MDSIVNLVSEHLERVGEKAIVTFTTSGCFDEKSTFFLNRDCLSLHSNFGRKEKLQKNKEEEEVNKVVENEKRRKVVDDEIRRVVESARKVREKCGKGTLHFLCSSGMEEEEWNLLGESRLDSFSFPLFTSRKRYLESLYGNSRYLTLVKRAIASIKQKGKIVCLEFFILPGFSDEIEEFESLVSLLKEIDIDKLKLKNFVGDSTSFLSSISHVPSPNTSILELLKNLQSSFPNLHIGYHNMPKYSSLQ